MTVLLAMILDAIFGEPKAIWSRVPHPAVMIGNLIGFLDRKLNHEDAKKVTGVLAVAVLVFLSLFISKILTAFGPLIVIVTSAIFLAQRSLCDHIRNVANDLRLDVVAGRRAVAMIVGRDTKSMTPEQVSRSAIESGAENLSDGVIAPLFWLIIAGLPGLLLYKFINTADSMIGYKTDKYREFGWAAARLDDVLNYIPARITAFLILLVAGKPHRFFDLKTDAQSHTSINAGWPEAAMARILNVSLSGPRSYNFKMQDFPWVNEAGRKSAGPKDIDECVTVLWRVWGAVFTLVLICVAVFACS